MRVFVSLAAVVGVLVLSPAAIAQSVSSVDEHGIKRVVVFGDDPCPKSSSDEIVVCARRPDDDRYRIPERFRKPDSLTGDHEAWAYKAEQLEMVGASGIQSCSPVGPGGATGCMQQLINAARLENRKTKSEERRIP